MSPKFAFWAGVVSTVAVASLLGFIVLLGVLLSDRTAGAARPTVGSTPTAQAPSGPPPDDKRTINIKPVSKEDHIRGPKDAKITLIEFSDLECPFCKRFHDPMKQLVAAFPKDVAWIYRHFPLDQLHSKARREAAASECASEQGKFWEFVDGIFAVTPSNDGLDPAELPKIAQRAGVRDLNKFNKCLETGKYKEKVQAQLDDAVAAGGRGTPYSVVFAGDQKIPLDGAVGFEQLKSLVEQFK